MKVRWSILAALLIFVPTGFANAGQGITGKKFLLQSTPKMVLLSKDALVVPGATGGSSDPRCIAAGGSDSGASLKLSDGTNIVTLNMPCGQWLANGAGTLYKYKDSAGAPKVGKLKAGLLKVISPGIGSFPVPNGPATVTAEVTVGTDKYCMSFSGTGDGSKFLVKDASAGTCPGSGAVCGNNIKEGTEQCDGTDATACPGNCRGDCTCPTQTCGNDVREGSEVCDGVDATACPGVCQADCTCPNACPQTGGAADACLTYTDPGSACRTCVQANAPGDGACPFAALGYQCLNSAYNDSCSAVVNTHGCASACCPPCGNNVREGIETCDGTDDSACPGNCQADCSCPVCGDNVREGSEECDGTDDAACPGLCLTGCICGGCCANFYLTGFGIVSCIGGLSPSSCTSGAGTPGSGPECCSGICCQFASTCAVASSELDCNFLLGTPHSGSACMGNGRCQP